MDFVLAQHQVLSRKAKTDTFTNTGGREKHF